jgi:hypothetical protein
VPAGFALRVTSSKHGRRIWQCQALVMSAHRTQAVWHGARRELKLCVIATETHLSLGWTWVRLDECKRDISQRSAWRREPDPHRKPAAPVQDSKGCTRQSTHRWPRSGLPWRFARYCQPLAAGFCSAFDIGKPSRLTQIWGLRAQLCSFCPTPGQGDTIAGLLALRCERCYLRYDNFRIAFRMH